VTEAVAPQNLEAEEYVLGALLLEGAAGVAASLRKAEEIRELGLEPTHFYRKRSHGEIYAAALALVDAGRPTDFLAVEEELRQRGTLEQVGGGSKVRELAASVPATANAAYHAQLIVDAARRRSQLRTLDAARDAVTNGGLPEHPETRALLHELIEEPETTAIALPVLDLPELLSGPMPEVDWLWGSWLARGDLALLVGDPGVGKSLLALCLADAVRRGASFLDERCARGRVGVVDLENPLAEVHKRLRQVGVTSDNVAGLAYVHGEPVNLMSPIGLAQLRGMIEEHELDLVVIDSLRRAAPGLDENDSAEVAQVFSPLRQLTATSGRVIVVIHHARKKIGDNPTDAGQMVRGSGDLVASVDVLLYARAKEAGKFTLEHGKARRGFPHPSILVAIENESDDPTSPVRLVNEGEVAMAEDKVEAMLARITRALADDGGPLERAVLALRVETSPKDRSFARALSLGKQREQLASNDENRKVGEPALYSLAYGGPA
jgi:hypothetical protein